MFLFRSFFVCVPRVVDPFFACSLQNKSKSVHFFCLNVHFVCVCWCMFGWHQGKIRKRRLPFFHIMRDTNAVVGCFFFTYTNIHTQTHTQRGFAVTFAIPCTHNALPGVCTEDNFPLKSKFFSYLYVPSRIFMIIFPVMACQHPSDCVYLFAFFSIQVFQLYCIYILLCYLFTQKCLCLNSTLRNNK